MKYAIICLVTIVSLLGLTTTVHAQRAGGSYTFIEGSFESSSFDTKQLFNQNTDGAGGRFEASLAMHKNVYIVGSYQAADLDDISAAIPLGTAKTWQAGLGFNTALSSGRMGRNYRSLRDQYTLFVDAQYISAKTGLVANETYSDGFAFETGLRTLNFTPFEFIASVGYQKFENIDGEFIAEARLLYQLVGNLQIQGGVDYNDNVSSWFLGLRYNIPNFAVF